MMSRSELPLKTQAAPRSLWAGLLFGALLMIFVAAFAYVAYLFLVWGQTAMAQAPDMPPLELPRIVRSASSTGSQTVPGASALLEPLTRRVQEAAPVAVGRTTVLVVGVDARPGQSVAQHLTDSIIVLSLNPQTGSAGMLSIPRDLKVRPSALNSDVKINMVHPIGEARGVPGGGPAFLSDAVSELIGYPIDYYVRVNFDGFTQIVDLVGGVDIDVPYEINDPEYPDQNYGFDPLYIPAGRQHMDGTLALKYARTRHADNDYLRAGRQQQVVMAIKDKVMQPGQLESLLPRLPRLAIAMANSVQTNMPIDKAIALARALDKVDLDNITRVVIDQKMGAVDPADPQLGYVLIPDMNKVRAAADAIFSDVVAGPSPEEVMRQTIQAEAARILILNGTQEKGLASKMQATLITAGFNVVTVGNADRADYAETWLVSHGETAPATLEELARRFGIPADRILSEPSATDVDVTLIVGQDQVSEQ